MPHRSSPCSCRYGDRLRLKRPGSPPALSNLWVRLWETPAEQPLIVEGLVVVVNRDERGQLRQW